MIYNDFINKIEDYGNTMIIEYIYNHLEYETTQEIINDIVNDFPLIQEDNIHNFYNILNYIIIDNNINKHPIDIVHSFQKYYLLKYLKSKEKFIEFKLKEYNKISNID